MNDDLISREALKKHARVVFDKDLGRLIVVDVFDIDNAPTVAINCKDCDGYEAGYSAGLNDAERQQGKWIQLKDNVHHFMCSVCGDADYYEDWIPKFCPECGARMRGTIANKCESCIHDKEKSEPRTCSKCRIFDKYEPNCKPDIGGDAE